MALNNICHPDISDQLVPNTNFTIGWICKILNEHDDDFKKVYEENGKSPVIKVY